MNRILLAVGLVLVLSACVTEVTGTYAQKVDDEVVMQNLIDLGIGYLRQGNYARAKYNLSKALEIDSGSPLAHTTFGVVFQLEGENSLAEDHFKQALKSDPTFSQARNNYGAFLFDRGRYAEAIEQLEFAAQDRFYPKRPQVFENMGVCYQQMDEMEKSEQAFIRAVELNINQSRALLELARIRFDQQHYVEANRLFRRHLSVSQQSAVSLWLCVQLARKFDKEDEEASCALVLKNIFPASAEFKEYQQSL
jgi:type IV pilus assembly protein PilF